MPIKILISIPVMFFLTLLQGSFLPHFAVFGYTPNIVFFAAVLLIFFLPNQQGMLSVGFISALAGGVFLDIYSANFIGFNVMILTGTVFFIGSILKKYVKIPIR